MTYLVISDLAQNIRSLYKTGLPRGASTGWPTVDAHYTVAMNQWTLVTGVPHSGKSEWLDALMVNLAKQGEWGFSIFSPENHPLELHASKILEKYIGKPFGRGPTERMGEKELEDGMEWMSDKFFFIKMDEPSLPAIVNHIADSPATIVSKKHGIVVDPWNTLEHRHPKDMTLTQYVSEQLSWIVNYTRNTDVHFWLVAHPRKLNDKDRQGKPPTPYDIADSAHFYNKADNIITVHRNQLEQSQEVEIHIQKVRFKHIGRIGMVKLVYDRTTGRYHEKHTDHAIAHYYQPRSAA